MDKRDRRNINPTPEAVVAMNLFGTDYGHQNGGSMDFWDNLSEGRKRRCRMIANAVIEQAAKHKRTPSTDEGRGT